MADIFGRASDVFGGAFSADDALITFPADFGSGVVGDDGAALGLIAQNLQYNYQQQVVRIYELTSNSQYYIAGRTQGTAGMARILGPKPIQIAFYTKYGDVCNAGNNIVEINLLTGCTSGDKPVTQGFALTLKYLVITSLGGMINAQDMIVNEQVAMMFAALDLSEVDF